MIIPISDWRPDLSDYGNPGTPVMLNALPGGNSYKPMPTLVPFTGALTARPRGAVDARDKDNDGYQYAGDETKLYNLSGTTWSDVSKVGGYATGTNEIWDFARWKNQILATNFSDNIQTIEMGGANFADLTSAFRARFLFVVGEHVVAGNTFDATDGNKPDRIRWSAFRDETDWTVSDVTGSGFQDLKEDYLQGALGGEYGVIGGQRNTYRMDYVGGSNVFRILNTLPGMGWVAPRAAARIGDLIYAWTTQGFMEINAGTGWRSLGGGRMDEYAFKDLDQGYLERMTAAADPTSGRVFWAYPGSGNNGGRPNKLICYDRHLDRFGPIEDSTLELLWGPSSGIAYTIDQLDAVSSSADDLPVTLDSAIWQGKNVIVLAAFDKDNKHGYYEGPAMDAIVETREVQLNEGHQTMLGAFRPLVDGGTVTCQVGTRNKQTDDVSWTPILTPRDTGVVKPHKSGRYHRVRMRIEGDWKDVIGVQIDPYEMRTNGRRGR